MKLVIYEVIKIRGKKLEYQTLAWKLMELRQHFPEIVKCR